MLNNLLKHSIRSFKRQRSYVIINVLGLAIGIACSLLIILYIINESSYDKYNDKSDRIYRAILDGKIGGQEVMVSYSPAVLGPTLLREFPEVEAFLRMNGRGPQAIGYGDQVFTDDNVIDVDSSFFDFFSIPVIKGDRENLLNAPHKVVISQSAAARIFGEEDPIDKPLKIGSDTVRYIVSGVMADTPEKSHFKASMITSFMTSPRSQNPTWLSNNLSTYLLLKPNTSFKTVEEKLHPLLTRYVGPEIEQYMGISLDDFADQGNRYRFWLQNLADIHLTTGIQQEFKPSSDPKYLQVFSVIAVLIVLMAAINFMNLATAQSSRRAKEVGIKKVAGTTKGVLIAQFLTESFILTLIALVLAVIMVKASLSYFNDLLDVQLKLSLLSSWYTIPLLIMFALLVGLLAGSYPSFFLSSFKPYEVLKGSLSSSMKNGKLRRILVIFQFAISILLIIGTMVMYRQINFMLNKDVGFNKEQLIVINRAHVLNPRMKAFKDEVKEIPGVINIASSTAVPGRNNNNNGYGIEGRSDESFILMTAWVDYSFIDTYGMKLASGRNFNESFTSDKEACILNEAAVKNFTIESVENTRLVAPQDSGKKLFMPVIGVVENFNFESLRNPVNPYVFRFQNDDMLWGYVSVRISPDNYRKTISSIESKWKEFVPDAPMQYYFMDEDFEQMYIQEKQNAQMAVIFSILAIFVAGLGLFGLTSFTVEQRTKEIGVRKAMGSSVAGIYLEISREIMILVSVSALLAWPVVYYWSGRWLENFYFRINPGIISFVAGLAIALGIALATISFRIIRAARVNPARSLRYE